MKDGERVIWLGLMLTVAVVGFFVGSIAENNLHEGHELVIRNNEEHELVIRNSIKAKLEALGLWWVIEDHYDTILDITFDASCGPDDEVDLDMVEAIGDAPYVLVEILELKPLTKKEYLDICMAYQEAVAYCEEVYACMPEEFLRSVVIAAKLRQLRSQ